MKNSYSHITKAPAYNQISCFSRLFNRMAVLPLTLPLCLVLVLGVGNVWGQATNPSAHNLASSNFSFTTQTATNTAYPTSMQGWTTGTNNIASLTTSAPAEDQALVASGLASTSGLSNLGSNGFNFLSTSNNPNRQVGAICLAINTNGRTSINVSWLVDDQTGGSTREMNITLQYRVGTSGTFTTVSSTTYTTSNNSDKASQSFSNISLPVACENESVVQLRWITYESASQTGGRDAIRLDEISVTSTAAASPSITIGGSTSATATAFTTTYGTASTDQSFTIAGSDLTADISVAAVTGYEYSIDGGSTWASTRTITQSGGSASATLRVRLAATAAVSGSYNSQSISLSSTGATSRTISTASSGNSVSAKALSITAPSIASKAYDGTTTAGAVTVGTLSGFVGSETVTATGSAAAYSSANVSTYNSVAVTYTLANGTNGGLAANYSLASGSATGSVTAKSLSITSPTIASKAYDGTTTAGAVTVGVLSGFVGSETVTATGSAADYSSPNVGSYPNVTVTYTLANGTNGGLAANYSLAAGSATGSVTAKSLSITAPTIASKAYDGTTTAGAVTVGVLSGFVGSETVTATGSAAAYSGANAGSYTTTVSYSLADGTNGGLANNYSLANTTGVSGSITKANAVINTAPTATDITLGQDLSNSSLSGGSATPSGGSFTFLSPATVPGSTGSYTADITYTPDVADQANYNNASGTTSVQVNAAGSPILTPVTLGTALSTTYGTASSGVAFAVGGLNLTTTITVTPQTGYEIATTLNGTYQSTAISGISDGSTLYVRFAATRAAGTYNSATAVQLSGGGASSTVNVTTSSTGNTVSAKDLNITGIGISNKTYDGTTSATITGTAAYSGLVNGDNPAVTGTPSAVFSDKNVANGKSITVSGYTAPNANYSITQPSGLTANITAKELSITAPSIASKTYDATTSAGAVTVGTLSGFVSTETVTATATAAAYSSANVGSYPNVTVTYTLANGTNGGLAANYSLAAGSATGSVTAKSLSITSPTIASKVYDGTTTAGAVTVGTLSGFVGSQTVTATGVSANYSSKDVGSYASSVITYTLVDGTNGGLATNYSLANGSATGTITTKSLSITTATIADKTYNASATSGTVTPGTLSEFVGSETVVVSSATGTYSDANVGTGKTATITYTLGNGTNGGLAVNYSLANTTAIGNITKANQTITALASPITKILSDAPYSVATSATSGLTVTYSSNNLSVATVAANGTVTIQGLGTATITASQAGDGNYNAATSVTQALTVNPNPSITATPSSLAAFTSTSGTASTAQAFTVTGSNLLDVVTVTPPTGYEVCLTSNGTYTSTVTTPQSGVATTVYVRLTNAATGTPSGNVAITSTSASTVNVAVSGTVNVCATLPVHSGTSGQAGWTETTVASATASSNDYLQMLSSASTLITPAINFNSYTNLKLDFKARTFGGPSSAQATITISISVNNGSSYSSITTVIPSSNSLVSQTQIDLSSYSGSQVLIRFQTLGAGSAKGVGIDDVTISGSCQIASISAGGGPLTSLTTTYGTPSSPTSFELSGSNLSTTISIAALSGFEFSATAGGAGAYTSTLSGISASGPTTIYVRLAASANVGTYSGNIVCSSGSTTLNVPMASSTVSKANQTITFASTNSKTFGDANYAPGATSASSGAIPITYASSNTSVATIVSGQINIVGVGTTTITASQAGNANYNAAADVTQTLTVNKANQSITFASTNSKTYGDADYAPGATSATSGTNAITYASSNAAVATIVAGQIHIVAPGTTTITASQAGNANYNAAADATQTLTVNPKSLTITGLTANSKYEDGNTNATLTGTAALSGVISGDDVSLTGTAVGTFASAAVGININVTVSNLSLTGTSASNYSLTTLILTADIIANSPTIFSSGTLSAVNTTYGSASPSPSSFSVSAQSLTDPVTITAPSGFEVSTNISSGYSSSINVGTSGTLASTTIYVRLTNATTVAASPYSGNIVLSSNGATSVNVATASSTVSQKNLTITGMTTANKVYDGTNSAIVTGGSLVGILGSDVVTLTQSGTFAQTSVGTNIVITSTSTIGGAASGNYTLTQPSLTLRDITTKPLSITTATIASKVYDGTTTSGTVTAGTLSGFIGSDTVVVASANGTYSDANVGTGKTATITYTLGNGTNGGLATNYSLANTSATGNITQATQTITFSSFTTPITASTTIVASSNFGGTITYSSSNTNVATINSSTGVVTIAGNGTTTITASNAGNSNYTAASTSQVLTVNSAVTSTLAAWEVTGLTGYGPSPFTATTISNNVTVGGLTKGNGIGSQGTAASNAWGGTDLDKTSSNDATSGDDFISFTINANIGYTVSFTQIPSYNIRRSSSGATTGLWQYSIDGSNFTNIGSAITWGGTTTSGGNSQSAISLSGITDLQNVPNSTTITFRLVLYGASNTTGTWYINNITGDDLAVTGTVNCTIPSQSSAISGTTTVCSGSAQTYSVTNVSGVGYNWSLPGGWSGSSTSNSISATVGSSGGNISVTPYNSATGCTNYAGTAQSISVTVNASPTAPAATITQPTCSVATGTITITSQSDVQYSINGTDYQVSNVFSGLSPNTYTIYVRSTLTGSCVASTGSQVVNAQPGAPGIPSAPTASAQSLCSGSSVSNLVATGTSIQWYDAASNGILLAGGTSLTAGTYYASQTVSGCESSTRTSVAVTINSTGTWIGGASGNWNVAGNWCGGVPNSSSTISIPTSTTVSIDASSNVLDITIGSGATLNFSGSHIITIAAGGSFMNNGTFVAGTGTVAYAGAGTLDGSASTFNNLTVSGPLTVNTSPTINGILTINNGGSIITNPITYGPSATLVYNQGGAVSSTNYEWPTVNLPTNVTIQNASNVTINESKNINGILTLTSGDLILGANILTLGASASISSASSSSHIDATSSGEVRKIYNGNGSFTFPVGDGTNYTPATLNFTAGSSITGATDDYVGVRLKTSKVTGMNNTNQHYINRAWFIEPGAGLSGYTYSVELSYCNADIIGTESLIRPVKRSFENSVYVWYYPGDVNFTDGIQLTGTTSEINTITKGLIWSGLTSFSEFGGVGQGGLLPVDLLFFNANAIENKVKLYWATSLEINNEKFEIERSADAVSFTKIATVSGGGNTTTLQNYTVYDEQPLSGWSYYRLKQIDFDQAFEYSNVASVYFEEGEFAIAVYPNPAQNSIMIQTFGDAKIYNAAIYNSFGQEIRKAESNINMSIEDLASGTYTIKVQTGLHIITKQFVKF